MLLLASQSPTRHRLLTRAGIAFRAIPAPIDERACENAAPHPDAGNIALHLAHAKATAVSTNHPNSYVLGADQLLTCNGKRYHKPLSTMEARNHLLALRGQTHELHTAICVVQNGNHLLNHIATPRLTMRAFSDSFLEAYLNTQAPDVLQSPGCYRYEETGIQLFDKIEGDMHSILGLPLLPLLTFLRSKELLPS